MKTKKICLQIEVSIRDIDYPLLMAATSEKEMIEALHDEHIDEDIILDAIQSGEGTSVQIKDA